MSANENVNLFHCTRTISANLAAVFPRLNSVRDQKAVGGVPCSRLMC